MDWSWSKAIKVTGFRVRLHEEGTNIYIPSGQPLKAGKADLSKQLKASLIKTSGEYYAQVQAVAPAGIISSDY